MKNKILIIEDDEDLQQNLKEILQHNNFDVSTANNGNEALEILNDHEFDIIISDLLMPVMDGLSFMSNIKKRSGFENIPFIFLSGSLVLDDQRHCIELGADDYLHKPITSQSLLKAIYGGLEKRNKREKWAKEKMEVALKEDRRITFHEFRTPLAGVSSIFELMETSLNEFDKNEFHELIQIGKESISRVNESLNKLSLFNKLDMLILYKTKIEFDFEMFKLLAYKVHDKFSIGIWDFNGSIFFDRSLFNFLINELVSNAVKFSSIGYSINVSMEGNTFHISNHQDIIYESSIYEPKPFSQLKREYLEQQGFGLGLFLCKQIASLHGYPLKCEIDQNLKFHVFINFNEP